MVLVHFLVRRDVVNATVGQFTSCLHIRELTQYCRPSPFVFIVVVVVAFSLQDCSANKKNFRFTLKKS